MSFDLSNDPHLSSYSLPSDSQTGSLGKERVRPPCWFEPSLGWFFLYFFVSCFSSAHMSAAGQTPVRRLPASGTVGVCWFPEWCLAGCWGHRTPVMPRSPHCTTSHRWNISGWRLSLHTEMVSTQLTLDRWISTVWTEKAVGDTPEYGTGTAANVEDLQTGWPVNSYVSEASLSPSPDSRYPRQRNILRWLCWGRRRECRAH